MSDAAHASAASDLTVGRAALSDVDAIAELLRANEAPRGSLTGHFSRAWVEAHVGAMPVLVARVGEQVVGALFSSTLDAAREQPILSAMLAVYRGGADAYVYGPICVAQAARGRGVAGMLFERLKRELPGREGILFIRQDNEPSLRAHQRLAGMRVQGELVFEGAPFVVLSYVD